MIGVGIDHGAAVTVTERAAERDAWAVLVSVDGLGPVGFAALLRRFGSGRRVLEAAVEPGGPERIVQAGNEPDGDGARPRSALTIDVGWAIAQAAERAPAILDRIRALDLEVVTVDDVGYPSRLAGIDFPPHVLFIRGSAAALDRERAVAVVGTRRATSTGRAVAARIAAAISRAGATVVSGLALGIDGAAHAATVDAGGRTVAVLGGGHAQLYPRAHARLADEIVAADGAVISERAPDVGPTAWSFPRRNRVISGLADSTVVVEAPVRSGALVTASWALEQGRGCFLVPGAIDSDANAGCLSFLREFPEGARIVSGVPQLIEDLGLVMAPSTAGATALAGATLADLGGTAATVAAELVDGRATVDELVSTTRLPVATVLATLTLLERQGLAVGVFGRYRAAGSLAAAEPRRPRRRAR